jgi:hypothetical protein
MFQLEKKWRDLIELDMNISLCGSYPQLILNSLQCNFHHFTLHFPVLYLVFNLPLPHCPETFTAVTFPECSASIIPPTFFFFFFLSLLYLSLFIKILRLQFLMIYLVSYLTLPGRWRGTTWKHSQQKIFYIISSRVSNTVSHITLHFLPCLSASISVFLSCVEISVRPHRLISFA